VVLLGLWVESLRRLRERQRALTRLETEMPSRRERRAATPDAQGAGSEGGPA
jgi:hypothetical protein